MRPICQPNNACDLFMMNTDALVDSADFIFGNVPVDLICDTTILQLYASMSCRIL